MTNSKHMDNKLSHDKQIPVWALINFQFLYQLHLSLDKKECSKISIEQLINRTSNHLGCSPHLSNYWSPLNAGTVFSFLYAVIVVPKEIFSTSHEDLLTDFRIEFSDVFTSVDFGIEMLNSPEKIIRFLRNSISHVNYEIDNKNTAQILMWNKFGGNNNIQVSTNVNRLANFGVRFAQHFAQLLLD